MLPIEISIAVLLLNVHWTGVYNYLVSSQYERITESDRMIAASVTEQLNNQNYTPNDRAAIIVKEDGKIYDQYVPHVKYLVLPQPVQIASPENYMDQLGEQEELADRKLIVLGVEDDLIAEMKKNGGIDFTWINVKE